MPATWMTSQAWRVYSETFRADYRGPGRLTAYQVMAAISVAPRALAPFLLPDQTLLRTSLAEEFGILWDPEAIFAVQGIWIALFLCMGRSTQTWSDLRFRVRTDRI